MFAWQADYPAFEYPAASSRFPSCASAARGKNGLANACKRPSTSTAPRARPRLRARSAHRPRVRRLPLLRHPVPRCLPGHAPPRPQAQGEVLRTLGVLKPLDTSKAWLAPFLGDKAVPAAEYKGEPEEAVWLPNEAVAKAWMEYVKTGAVGDTTPPPAPTTYEPTPRYRGAD